jgi:hypothetical protein
MSTRSVRPTLRGTLTVAVCLMLALAAAAHAATPGELVAGKRAAGASFAGVSPFGVAKAAGGDLSKVLRSGVTLTLDAKTLADVRRERPETMSMALPGFGGSPVVILDLVRVELFAPGFTVTKGDGIIIPWPALGEHYRGVVRGDEESMAAISFLDNEIAGFAASPRVGYLVLGRLEGNNPTNKHVLYPASSLIPKQGFTCAMGDSGAGSADEVISYWDATRLAKSASVEAAKVAGANVKIYVEADYDLYQEKGSVAAVTSYLTGVFNQSATLYSAESIPIVMSQLVVWDRRSPYKGNSSSQLLASFQKNRNSFNGDLGHLVARRGGGGIAAGFNGFCAANRDDSQCFSMLDATYNNVPTYSWTVMVFTHEMGHLMGSRHTHACVWNGNNTQIDGCSTPEGTCPRLGYPAGGGTIMSYCHLQSVGINFNNGFGPQPGNVIRSRFAAASCLTP